MKIIEAREKGFCFGVKRASDIALGHAKIKEKINTLGPLIHNKQFTKHLEERNIFEVAAISEIDAAKVVIRSHGITKQEEEELRKKGIEIIDATCPFVKRVHKLAGNLEKEGYKVFIYGEEDHQEVIGIKSYAKDPVVVKDILDIPDLPKDTKVALISQTTQNIKLFQVFADYLTEKYPNTKVISTICDATERRQEAAKRLAQKVDIMIIVGGKHSSNTSRLHEVCASLTKSHHIETEDELRENWFAGVETVGVTAGASTPDFIIKKVIDKIKTYEK